MTKLEWLYDTYPEAEIDYYELKDTKNVIYKNYRVHFPFLRYMAFFSVKFDENDYYFINAIKERKNETL